MAGRPEDARAGGVTPAWTHDALAADLLDARHLANEISIERLRVGPGYSSEGVQLDVAAMRLSWTNPRMTGYEVKVTRADFLADLRAEKWRKYLPCVHRLFFAVPKGLVDEREVPPECGLIVRGRESWRTAKVAPVRPLEANAETVFALSLLYRHYPSGWDGPTRARNQVLYSAGLADG